MSWVACFRNPVPPTRVFRTSPPIPGSYGARFMMVSPMFAPRSPYRRSQSVPPAIMPPTPPLPAFCRFW